MSFLNRIKRIAKYMSFEEFRFDLEYLWFRLQERKYIAAKTPELREIDDLVRNDEKCDMNAKGRLVSIIIPSKDNPKLLSDLLKSVREKEGSLHPEIIVVDNGSSNENRRIYEEIAKRLPTFIIRRNSIFQKCAMRAASKLLEIFFYF